MIFHKQWLLEAASDSRFEKLQDKGSRHGTTTGVHRYKYTWLNGVC